MQLAIHEVDASGRNVSAVVFGHMHHLLYQSTEETPLYRTLLTEDRNKSICYINSAVVPRIGTPFTGNENEESTDKDSLHHFTLVDLVEGKVEKVEDVWVRVETTEVHVHERTQRIPKYVD